MTTRAASPSEISRGQYKRLDGPSLEASDPVPDLSLTTYLVQSPEIIDEPAQQRPASNLLVWPAGLIRASAAVIILFELAQLLGEMAAHLPDTALGVPLRAVCVTLGILLLACSFQPKLQQLWQVAAFVLTTAVVICTTILGIAQESADQFFVDLLVLSLGASSLLPWSFGFQAAANLFMLGCLALYARFAPTQDPLLYTHWVGLVAGAGVVQLCSKYASRYRQEARNQIESAIQAVNRLRQSEATLRRIFQVSCDSISVMRLPDCRYLKVNEEFLRQGAYKIDDVMGRSAMEVGPAVFRDARFRSALMRHGEIRNMDFALERPGGSPASALLSAVKVEIDNQPCVVTFARDITELKRSQMELIAAREAALAASRAKTEFLSSMSHEIRTPMNAVLGMADVLADTDLTSEQRRYVSTIVNNGNALLELINGILDLAKVESGRVSLESVEFSPREVVERVLETLAVRAHEKRLQLVTQIDDSVPEVVLGDPLRLRQILVNLVANAVKFTERGHVLVKLQTETTNAEVFRFEVHDTGIGITAANIPALFQPFNQADSSTSRRYGGSGLGLAIVGRLVALMGGETAVESTLGAGSVFRFTARFGRARPSAAQPRQLPDLSRMRILVADESRIRTEMLCMLLTQRGASIAVTNSGSRFLELIQQDETAFDAIITDSSMSTSDGRQVLPQIAGKTSAHARLIVMISADNLNGETNRLELLGLCRYIVKPVKRGELLAVIAALTGSHSDSAAAGHSRERRIARLSPPRAMRGLRILFADDSPDNRALIKAYLKSTPYEIDFAENGQEAIGRVLASRYDLTFMDIQMPIVDGYAAVREIRDWEKRSGRAPMPIIALTASADADAVRRTIEAGCNLHVSKPLKKHILLETISRYAHPSTRKFAASDRKAVA